MKRLFFFIWITIIPLLIIFLGDVSGLWDWIDSTGVIDD